MTAEGDHESCCVPSRVPEWCRRQVVTLRPGTQRPYHDVEWRDAIVFVAQGAIELEDLAGGRRRFALGDTLWLADLPLRAIHNPDAAPAVLITFSRGQTTTPAGRSVFL